MLLNIGEGVILDALLRLGFTCTYDDVDLARLTATTCADSVISVDVTRQLVSGDEKLLTPPHEPPSGLIAPLAMLHDRLSKVGCCYDFDAHRKDESEAVFVRYDTFVAPRLGRPMTTKVIVRARVEQDKKKKEE